METAINLIAVLFSPEVAGPQAGCGTRTSRRGGTRGRGCTSTSLLCRVRSWFVCPTARETSYIWDEPPGGCVMTVGGNLGAVLRGCWVFACSASPAIRS